MVLTFLNSNDRIIRTVTDIDSVAILKNKPVASVWCLIHSFQDSPPFFQIANTFKFDWLMQIWPIPLRRIYIILRNTIFLWQENVGKLPKFFNFLCCGSADQRFVFLFSRILIGPNAYAARTMNI